MTRIWFSLKHSQDIDLTPSLSWREPVVAFDPAPDHGPVLVMVEYRIEPSAAGDFARTMHQFSRLRRRDGALRWGLYSDAGDPCRYIEAFLVESWAEHLRQHARFTLADRDLEKKARSFHRGERSPAVTHMLYASPQNGAGGFGCSEKKRV